MRHLLFFVAERYVGINKLQCVKTTCLALTFEHLFRGKEQEEIGSQRSRRWRRDRGRNEMDGRQREERPEIERRKSKTLRSMSSRSATRDVCANCGGKAEPEPVS